MTSDGSGGEYHAAAVLESQSEEEGFRRNPEVVAREIGSREADPEIGPDIPAQSHGVSRRDELDRLGIHLPEIGAPHHSTGNREYQPGLVLGLAPARMGPETTQQASAVRRPAFGLASAPQELVVYRETAIHYHRDPCLFQLPGNLGRAGRPTCIQTSCGLTSSSCSSRAGMYSERRKIFTISMGPAAARRSGDRDIPARPGSRLQRGAPG